MITSVPSVPAHFCRIKKREGGGGGNGKKVRTVKKIENLLQFFLLYWEVTVNGTKSHFFLFF